MGRGLAINTTFEEQVKLFGAFSGQVKLLLPLKSAGWLIRRNDAVPLGSHVKLRPGHDAVLNLLETN